MQVKLHLQVPSDHPYRQSHPDPAEEGRRSQAPIRTRTPTQTQTKVVDGMNGTMVPNTSYSVKSEVVIFNCM